MEIKNTHSLIVDKIIRSRKYSRLSAETIERIVEWASLRYKKSEVEKNAKKKLHQIYAAYFPPSYLTAFDRKLEELYQINEEQVKEAYLEVLQLHSSSQERIPDLSHFYEDIFELIGIPDRLIDLACGLNPFSYPWIEEAAKCVRYIGYDIDLLSTEAMDHYFSKTKFPVNVRYNDLFLGVPAHSESDVVMLLKTLPCLEQQEKGISQKIVSAIQSRYIVISFPSKSLSGRDKGMVEHYKVFLYSIIDTNHYDIQEVKFSKETVYILEQLR